MSSTPGPHDSSMQHEAVILKREKVMRRFEDENGEDLFNDDGTVTNVFDKSTWTTAMEDEENRMLSIFNTLIETNIRAAESAGVLADKKREKSDEKPKMNSSEAAVFFSRISHSNFFAKANKPKELKPDDVKELLHLCLPTADMKFTYDALSAACYAWRSTSSAQLPGEDPYDIELERELKLSKDEEFRFRVAFSVIAGKEDISPHDMIEEDSLVDVFSAQGYSMQPADMEYIQNLCEIGEDGMINVDSALQAYELWRDDQLQLTTLKAIFNTLVADEKLHKGIPDGYKNKVVGRTELSINALRRILNSVLSNSGADKLTNDEVFDIAGEISSSINRTVTLQDFVRLFNTHYKQREIAHM